jgi:hypothetical protein
LHISDFDSKIIRFTLCNVSSAVYRGFESQSDQTNKKKHVHIRSNPRGRIYTNRQKYQHGSHIRRAKTIILRTLFENSRFNKYINVLL